MGMQIRQGDVFRWRYTDEVLKRKEHGNNGGTTYWAVSCIVIVDEYGDLVDTWSSYGRSATFHQEDIGKIIEVTYLGNMNDYREAHESERAKYLDADCMDISHANSSRNNFYIRKDAVENEDKSGRSYGVIY